MSRTLSYPLCLVAVFSLLISPVSAQTTGRARVGGTQPSPAGTGSQLPEQKMTPVLKKILDEWYEKTKKVKKLEGKHYKFDYEMTFAVEKRGIGHFYYEAPDKGRIDVEPDKSVIGRKSTRIDKKTGKPFTMKVAEEEKWYSDGTAIRHVIPPLKKVLVYPIPPENRGVNIMDGPLPFLLGMPPDKALQRFVLQIDLDNDYEVRLTAWPKWRSDRNLYQYAKVILVKGNHYLPRAVQLVNNGKETVYTFDKLEVNKKGLFPGIFQERDPFKLDLSTYTIESMLPKGTGNVERRPDNGKKVAVPDLSKMHYKMAAEQLRARGLSFRVVKGSVIKDKKFEYFVEGQSPAPKTMVSVGQKVTLSLYILGPDPNQKVAVPDVSKIPYKAAQERLRALGLNFTIQRGSVTSDPKFAYYVESQSPAPKSMVAAGEKVTLVLYIKAEDAKPVNRTAARP